MSLKYKYISVFIIIFTMIYNAPNAFPAGAKSNKKISEQAKKKKLTLKKSKKEVKSTEEKDSKKRATKREKKSKQKKLKIKKSTSENKKKEQEREKKIAKWIERTLEYGIQKERKDALNRILTIKDKSIKKRLEKIIIKIIKNEINPEVKRKAITVAGELELKEALPELITALNDSSDDVKISAVYGIKRVNGISATGELAKKLKEQDLSKDSTFIEALIDTLGKFKSTQLKDYAIKAIKDENTSDNIRESLVLFLGRAGARGSKDFLIKLLKDDDEAIQVRAFAANSLANLGIKETAKDIDNIIQQIESYPFKKKKKHYNLYMHCIAALAKFGDDKVFPHLMNSLRSDNSMVRLRAIRLIKQIKNKRTIDILKYKMKFDPNPKIQRAAKEALKELGVDVDKETGKSGKSKKPDKKSDKRNSAKKALSDTSKRKSQKGLTKKK